MILIGGHLTLKIATILTKAIKGSIEANGGLQLAKVRAALSLLVDLKQAGEAVE